MGRPHLSIWEIGRLGDWGIGEQLTEILIRYEFYSTEISCDEGFNTKFKSYYIIWF
ncbi:hypothetical protein H1P_2140016 [Hyella patelloides LEGE 07179]|uniref:Uncharacterized protein n=1 Tax=Hyella patelloides LEGE 07179 TaxID=945734 RepID=A0A563VQQ7_9CYAN|nr:hypothetical protein H1P_2140016 [Hyella patelloides LEGE 07179]